MKNIIFILAILTANNTYATKRYALLSSVALDQTPYAQTAFASCAATDTVILPGGDWNFLDDIYESTPCSLEGSKDPNNPTICRRPNSMTDAALDTLNCFFWFAPESTQKNLISISYIKFIGRTPAVTAKDGGSISGDQHIRITNCDGFIVHNCEFWYAGYAGIYIEHYNNRAYGLITKSKFVDCAKGWDGLGLGYAVVIYGEGGTTWEPNARIGTSEGITIEYSYFQGNRHSVATNDGAKYVFRYNEVKNNVKGSGVDQHEYDGSDQGGRNCEVYGNRIITDVAPFYEFANTAARNAAVPPYVGFYGVQEDDSTTWIGSGTSAGNWTQVTGGSLPIAQRYGGIIVPTMSEYLLETAGIGIRGGEANIFDNEIRGYRIGVLLEDFYELDVTCPISYGIGYNSQLRFGCSHTGTDLAHGDGDVFVWNNKVSIFNNGDCHKVLSGNAFIVINRDFHLVENPNYEKFGPHEFAQYAK